MVNLATGGIFQLGYVTSDLDRAIERARSVYGIDEFMILDTAELMPIPALRIGMAWHGSLMIELIEPVERPNPVYTDMLPPGSDVARFHHSGHVCPDEAAWDEMLGQLRDNDIAIANSGEIPGLFKFIYGDFRHVDGQYREYALFSEEGRAFLSQIPGNREVTIFRADR